MMKRFFSILLVAAMLAAVGCGKKNIIPDDTLAEIFHDAFVINAYIDEEHFNLDSLQIYEPLFERYGYTAKDVIYTVGNFSRRKSARLGSVVEQAISRLEQESKIYAKKVVILDTINNFAVRSFTRTVYQDTLIKAKKRADSTAMAIPPKMWYIQSETSHAARVPDSVRWWNRLYHASNRRARSTPRRWLFSIRYAMLRCEHSPVRYIAILS